MSEDAADNIVTFPTKEPGLSEIENMMQFCERLNQGIDFATKALINQDTRIRRLELALNKAERDKPKPVILNAHGGKAN